MRLLRLVHSPPAGPYWMWVTTLKQYYQAESVYSVVNKVDRGLESTIVSIRSHLSLQLDSIFNGFSS